MEASYASKHCPQPETQGRIAAASRGSLKFALWTIVVRQKALAKKEKEEEKRSRSRKMACSKWPSAEAHYSQLENVPLHSCGCHSQSKGLKPVGSTNSQL